MPFEKELNQTTIDETAQEQKQEEKTFSQSEIVAIRQKIEAQYKNKLEKAQAEFVAQLEATNKELNFFTTTLPQLEETYIKNGGNKEYFNDWLTLNKEKLNYDDLDKSVKTTFETQKWALKTNNSFSAHNTLNSAINIQPNLTDDENFVENTVYKKIK